MSLNIQDIAPEAVALVKTLWVDQTLCADVIHAAVEHAVDAQADLTHLVTAVYDAREANYEAQQPSRAIDHNCNIAMKKITALEVEEDDRHEPILENDRQPWCQIPIQPCLKETIDVYRDLNDPDVDDCYHVTVRLHADGQWRYQVKGTHQTATILSYAQGYPTETDARAAGAAALESYLYWMVNQTEHPNGSSAPALSTVLQ